ncbi:ArsR/SmtB family transcription factor [Halopelagius longus]|uniref:ArsR family transcriptional regulator n=1 Tax=Halopelagius longus TaxID=1236180 RepID=A0A1H1GUM3_9EURY|nr:winged helix-turn-helix domain-containing protein [Halopelagius longus]RDI69568.1 ArsR family transcriptional regulator [Halopelagius longus]SDR16618.1 Helix-turn-helix domain-containing protein [Halopelagius longus]
MEQQKESEAFADDTPLVWLLGKPARVRILSVFVDERGYELNVSEIARQAGIARSTVYDHIDDFVDVRIVEETRQSEARQRYRLNEENDIAELLYKLDGVTLQALLERDGHLEE